MRTEGAKTVLRLRPPGAIGRFRFEPGMNEPTTRRLLRFSVFEVDLDSGELFKKGQKVKLQEQPFELLVELLKNAGAVVTREHLKERLWPGDTAGDFDSGLNRAINRIREVLGDSAESPHFIETLPRRGYRFIGTVSGNGIIEPSPVIQVEHPPPKRRWPRLAITGIALAAVALFTWLWTHGASAPAPPLKLRQLTTNSSENPIDVSAISPDGKYLAYHDIDGIRLQEISTGQAHSLPRPSTVSEADAWYPAKWFPDGTRMVAFAGKAGPDGRWISSAWSLPVLGKPVLIQDDAVDASVSPDGSLVAFTRGLAFDPGNSATREIWTIGPHGEDARKLVSNDGKTLFYCVRWSPDSSRIAYLCNHTDKNPWTNDIETIPLAGGPPVVAVRDTQGDDFSWSPDGRIVYTRSEPAPNNNDTNLWALKVDPKTGRPQSKQQQMTNLAGFQMTSISLSSDGKKMIVQKRSFPSDIYIGRLKNNRQLEIPRRLTANERSNLPLAWTLDSKSIIFTSDRTGVNAIYKQEIDQNLAELISTGPERVWLPRVTPDGSSIVYFAYPDIQRPWESRFTRLMRVPISGGPREMVTQFSASAENLDCPIHTSAECVFSETSPSGIEVTFLAFNPLTKKLRELFKRKDYTSGQWSISPDGAHIGELRGDTIAVLSLSGQIEQSIRLSNWPYLYSIDWSADGKSFLVSQNWPTKTTLLRVGRDGGVQLLRERKNSMETFAIASPDGQYLAIEDGSVSSNAWLIENF